MRTGTRIFWLAVLAVFAGGCSTTRTGRWPGDGATPGTDGAEVRTIAPGDHVTVTRLDGSEVSGRIVTLSPDRIVVAPRTRVAAGDVADQDRDAEVGIDRGDIAGVTKREGSTGRTLLLVGGILVLTGAAAAAAVASMDLSMNFNGAY